MKLLVGLGNPGRQYENTRHNTGFMVLEKLLEEHDGAWGNEVKTNALVARITIGREDVILALPQTYMNLSGEAVRDILRWYKLSSSELIVIYDELDLPFGKIQVKKGGGDAGHNGIKSIIGRLGEEFIRVRVGIGRPSGNMPADKYVLENFSKDEEKELDAVSGEVIKKLQLLVTHGYGEFISKYNS